MKRGIGLQRQHANAQRIEYLGGEEQVAPHQGGVALGEKLLPRQVNPHGRRFLDRTDGTRKRTGTEEVFGVKCSIVARSSAENLLRPLRPAFQLPAIAGDPRGPHRSHHLAEFRNQDAVARDRAKVVRHGAIRRDPSLKNDGPVVVEKNVAHAGNDRSGLGAAGGGDHVAQRIAILELVDRGRAQHGADRRKLQG